jgi:hypothetical protein
MPPALTEAVESAYRVFARYRVSGALEVCHCTVCMTEEMERRLIATPLRHIPAMLLAEYTNSAHGYDDGRIADELRYLLPRYFELIAADDPPHPSLETSLCLNRLAYADWRARWPSEEAEAIQGFLDALIAARVRRTEPRKTRRGWELEYDIAEILAMIVTAGGDIARTLAVWDAVEDPPAALWMADQRRHLTMADGRPYYWNTFIHGDPVDSHREAGYEIGAFLARPETEARIEAAFFATSDPALQTILSDGLG